MGVELRVERPRGVLSERRGDDPFGVDDGDLAVDAVAGVGVGLDPVDHHRRPRCRGRRAPSARVSVVADREQGRHRLRRRRGDVEAADRVVAVAAGRGGPRRAAAGWSPAMMPEELAVDDLAFEAEPLGAAAVPDALRFAGVEVVDGSAST